MSAPAVLLRPMTEDEYARYARERDRIYVASLSASLPLPAAEAKAREDRARFLPQGARTPGHQLLFAEAQRGEEPPGGHVGLYAEPVTGGAAVVGAAWIGLTEPRTGSSEVAWLYDLWVDPDHRRRGYGRAVLEAVERRARDAGALRLGLNVFGENAAALGLYEALGYRVTTQQMAKLLG